MSKKVIISVLLFSLVLATAVFGEVRENTFNGYYVKQDPYTGAVTASLSSAPYEQALEAPMALIPGTTAVEANGNIMLRGDAGGAMGMNSNPTAGTAGNDLTVVSGAAAAGSTDQRGGDLIVTAGSGTGLAGGGNIRVQTAGADSLSGTTSNTSVDRRIIVAKAKHLTLGAPGFASLMSIHLTGTNTAGGRIHYMVRATDGGSQIATEEGVIQYLATANSITCTVQTTDKLHLGTVNSGCTPGFFNPGSQPGVSIFDNVAFSSPAAIVVHEVYFEIENTSGSTIRLEP